MPLCSMLHITTVIFGRVSEVRCGILGNRGDGVFGSGPVLVLYLVRLSVSVKKVFPSLFPFGSRRDYMVYLSPRWPFKTLRHFFGEQHFCLLAIFLPPPLNIMRIRFTLCLPRLLSVGSLPRPPPPGLLT